MGNKEENAIEKAKPWKDVNEWLDEIGLGQYKQNFQDHGVMGSHVAFLEEEQLRDMGIDSLGHRLYLLSQVKAFYHTYLDRRRGKVVMTFKNWYPVPLCGLFQKKFVLTESKLRIKDPQPFRCRQTINNIDITSIKDVQKTEGLFQFVHVVIKTSDRSTERSNGGLIKLRLRDAKKGEKIFKLVKDLVKADQEKMGRRGINKR